MLRTIIVAMCLVVVPSLASARKIVRHEKSAERPKQIENVTTAKGEPRTTWIVRSNNKTARPAKASKAKRPPREGRARRPARAKRHHA